MVLLGFRRPDPQDIVNTRTGRFHRSLGSGYAQHADGDVLPTGSASDDSRRTGARRDRAPFGGVHREECSESRRSGATVSAFCTVSIAATGFAAI